MTALEAIEKLEELKKELNGINQGINYFSHIRFNRLKKIMEQEKEEIENKILHLKLQLSNINL